MKVTGYITWYDSEEPINDERKNLIRLHELQEFSDVPNSIHFIIYREAKKAVINHLKETNVFVRGGEYVNYENNAVVLDNKYAFCVSLSEWNNNILKKAFPNGMPDDSYESFQDYIFEKGYNDNNKIENNNPIGQWVKSEKYPGFSCCSHCKDCYIETDWLEENNKWNYCPTCGVKMIKK